MTNEWPETLNLLGRDQCTNAGPTSSDLSPDSRARLLKWYSGNPFDTRLESTNKALSILEWCQESSDIFQYPAPSRRSIMKAAAEKLEISVHRLTDLMVSSSTFLGSSEATRLIAFEGIDDSGNTTQLGLLQHFLLSQRANVTVSSYPDYQDFFGREVASLKSGNGVVGEGDFDPKSVALWCALSRKSTISQIWPDFAGGFVLVNRYTLSSVVYQSVRSKLDLEEWILELEHTHLSVPAPDLYVVLDVSPTVLRAETSEARLNGWTAPAIELDERSISFITAARERYRAIADKYPQVDLIECMVDGQNMKTPDQIHAEIVSCLGRHHLVPIMRQS